MCQLTGWGLVPATTSARGVTARKARGRVESMAVVCELGGEADHNRQRCAQLVGDGCQKAVLVRRQLVELSNLDAGNQGGSVPGSNPSASIWD